MQLKIRELRIFLDKLKFLKVQQASKHGDITKTEIIDKQVYFFSIKEVRKTFAGQFIESLVNHDESQQN